MSRRETDTQASPTEGAPPTPKGIARAQRVAAATARSKAPQRPPTESSSPTAHLPDLADVEEVAAWLKTSPKAIYAMLERGQLVGIVRIGRRVLFDRADLVRWLSERRVASPQESRR